MASKFGKRGQRIASINMVPFIDIVLVLLIVFMIVTPVITSQHVHVDLPRVSSQAKNKMPNNQWVLSINKEGLIFLDRGANSSKSAANKVFSLNEAKVLVKSGLKASPNIALFIRADRSLSYGKVVEVMSAMQDAGVSNVGLITSKP